MEIYEHIECRTGSDVAIAAEKRLFEAVQSGDVALVERELADRGRDAVEFTGHCFAHAITQGMSDVAIVLGRAGCCLNVTDEPAVRNELANGSAGMRGLLGFLERYRYCRAQRTYYLPIVQSDASVEPVCALLGQGVGLTDHDKTELLSLAVRQDNVALARVLVEGGAKLLDDIHDAAPSDLRLKHAAGARGRHDAGQALGESADMLEGRNPWIEQLSPRSSMPMIEFVLDQIGARACPIRGDWFKLYFRDPQFGQKLALIAPHGCAELCDDTQSLLVELSRGGHAGAVAAVLAWGDLDADAIDAALEEARRAGHVEIAAMLLQARKEHAFQMDFLEF